jgi:hypothetical protein
LKNTTVQPIWRELPVPLTDEEKVEYANRVTLLTSEYDAVEAKKRESNAEFTSQLKQIRGHSSRLSLAVISGEEPRVVSCYWSLRPLDCEADLIRSDTSEVVEIRAMTDKEMQLSLPNV